MKPEQIHNRKELEIRRRILRKNGTPAEAFLWKQLQKSQLNGKKFRRQHSIKNFIVDFYCPSEKLIVELDGEYHNEPGQVDYDMYRQEKIEELGFKILRFENKMVFDYLPSVLKEIVDNFKY